MHVPVCMRACTCNWIHERVCLLRKTAMIAPTHGYVLMHVSYTHGLNCCHNNITVLQSWFSFPVRSIFYSPEGSLARHLHTSSTCIRAMRTWYISSISVFTNTLRTAFYVRSPSVVHDSPLEDRPSVIQAAYRLFAQRGLLSNTL
jgi:hypothetical protein